MNETPKPPELKNDNQGQTIIINQQKSESNGIGTAGFILAICAWVFSWVPILGTIVWFVGLILSFVGVFNKPRGLAIAGLVISLIGIIIFIFIFAGLAVLGGAAW